MKGMELARAYYTQLGAPLIRQALPEYQGRIAAGLVGEGSECYGYDDAYSQDHDFGPGFCLWVTSDTAVRAGKQIQNLYDSLPKEFMGYTRNETPEGKGRVGLFRIDYFYQRYTNCPGAPETNMQWMNVPERFLSVATNGEVFSDPEGEFTAVRRKLLAFYPTDVLRKKLAARAAVMAQAGQYNYPRCVQRGDRGAAFFAMNEFVQAALSAVFLLNRKYMPFYKWAFRAAGELTMLQDSVRRLRRLADLEQVVPPAEAQSLIEGICAEVAEELRRQDFSSSEDSFLAPHSGEIMAGIQDPEIRRLHVMADCG